jgi:hypothetical protein
MKLKLGAIAALMLGIVAMLLGGLTAPAASAATVTEPVCSTWKLRGTSGNYPGIEFGQRPRGAKVVSASEVVLVKPDGVGLEAPGVEFATFDLDVKTTVNTPVTVTYAMTDGATAAAGAVRMFWYDKKRADTINDGPSGFATATADNGTLTFEIPAGKKVGTLGLVYDASNSSKGKITFTDMTIGARPVSWTPCPQPSTSPTASPSVTPTASPSASVSVSPSATVSPSASVSTTPVAGGGPSLPVTGPGLPLATFGIGAALFIIGGAAILVTRRRQQFES